MKRILVIEDEPQMLLGLRDNLELEGYEVQTAADGEEGLAKAAAFAPDLVILDVMLPRKNGFDVCRELRARSNSTPVVMLTARSAETDKVLGLELGRGRLRHQAVLDHRAAGPGPRRAAADGVAQAGHRLGADRRNRGGLQAAPGAARPVAHRVHRPRVRAAPLFRRSTPARWSRASRS